MCGYRVPFDVVSPEEEPDRFDPGPILARILANDLLEASDKGTVEGTVSTSWGELGAERRQDEELLVQTPAAELTQRQVLLNVAAMNLGIDKATVQASHGTIQELDVGERVLVVPMDDEQAVRQAPDDVDPSSVAGVEATAGVAYVDTQRRPYARILARGWGDVRPLTALAAAAMHLVLSEGFRPTYPRTRIVGQLVDHGDEEAEITVQAREAGARPVVERVLVGGRVRTVEG